MTPSPSVDPVELLRARLDKDEQAARSATQLRWRVDNWANDAGREFLVVANEEAGAPAFGIKSKRDAEHIALHDPARVLAEVEAKREVIRLYEDTLETIEMLQSHGQKTDAHVGAAESYLNVIRAQVAVFAHRPTTGRSGSLE